MHRAANRHRRRRAAVTVRTIALVVAILGTACAAPTAAPQASSPPATAASRVSGTPVASVSSVTPATARPSTVRAELLSVRLPVGLSRAVAVADGGSVLVCGGLTLTGATTGAVVRVDPASGQVRVVGRLALAVHDAAVAQLGSANLIFGGGNTAPLAAVQQLDGATAVVVGQLPAPRADLTAVSVGGEVLVVGGGTAAGPDDEVLATSDGTRYRTVARLAVAVRYPAVAALDGMVYVIGGATPTGNSDAIQRIDPASGRVSVIGHLPAPMSHASAVVIGGSLFVAGGRGAGGPLDRIWWLDPRSGGVAPAGRLPLAVSDMAVAVVDGRALLIGGETDTQITSIVSLRPN